MAKRLKDLIEMKIERPPKLKLSAEESLKRTKEFDKRKEPVSAAIALLRSWRNVSKDEQQEQPETWELLEQALDEDRYH